VVLIESDDQTQEEMRFMPRVQRLIGKRGATFPVSVTNWPLCCPSRATMQTGQYAHNHGVLGNRPPLGGFGNLDIDHTLPVWLQRAGYYTAHIGKFLNGYEESPVGVPPGWSEWHGSKSTYRYYGYALLEDGQVVTYGNRDENPDDPADPASYSTDVYTEKAVDIIDREAPAEQPFFLSLAYLAPHAGAPNPDAPRSRCQGSAKPAARHFGAFAHKPLPHPPNFNEADISDKPTELAERNRLSSRQIAKTTRKYQCRAESLLAVDEGVGQIIKALRESGELDNTIVIYTSDNGFFHGEHRIPGGKNRVYEEAIRVPLLMRGPGIPRDTQVNDLAINADVPATIVDAAGATPDFPLDGVSLLPYTKHPDWKHGRELLIEQYSREGENGEPVGTKYTAIRTTRYKYVENASGQIELYDLLKDPYELRNVHGSPEYAGAERALATRLASLRDCAGKTCHEAPSIEMVLPTKERPGGTSCTPAPRGRVRVAVRNHAQSRLVSAKFRVNDEPVGSKHRAPWRRKLPVRRVAGGNRAEIAVDAELIDGRILTLHQRVRLCHQRG
jgi:arylsulfatase A-like enzyme